MAAKEESAQNSTKTEGPLTSIARKIHACCTRLLCYVCNKSDLGLIKPVLSTAVQDFAYLRDASIYLFIYLFIYLL
jgi:hypothetical protein